MMHDGNEESTASSLLNSVWSDRSSGWRRLLQQYAPVVYKHCRAAGLSAEDAADIGQEVFGVMARKIVSFHRDEDHHSFRGWLHTITRNKIIDHFRRTRREDLVSLEQLETRLIVTDVVQASEEAPTSPCLLSPRVREIIDKVQGEFESNSWQAFWRTVVEGQKSADVAAALKISVNAVYLSRSRILRRLRTEFDRHFKRV